MTANIWNFLRYVTIGITGSNNDQISGESTNDIKNNAFNGDISEISTCDKSLKNDINLNTNLCSSPKIISSMSGMDDNYDASQNKEEVVEFTKLQYCRALDSIIERHHLSNDAANEIRNLTERFTQDGISRNNFISNRQILDKSLKGLHYTKLEDYISCEEFLIDLEFCAQRFAPELIIIREILKEHSEFGSSIVDIRKIIQYMNDIRHPSKTNKNRMNLVKFIAKFWDSCEYVDTDRPGNYKYFMLFNAIANYVTYNIQVLSHSQLYHAYPMLSPFDVQYVLITKIKNKYNYIPAPKRVKI